MLKKIEYLTKISNSSYLSIRLSEYNSTLSASFFSDVIDSIINYSEITIKYLLDEGNDYDINVDRLLQLKSMYLKLNPTNDDEDFSISKYTYYKFSEEDEINDFCELIDIIYEINIECKKYYLTRDLIIAKEDCLINMKYFMNDEEINKFNIEYESAISEKNIQKMMDMLNDIQQSNLNEWNSYLGNIENMTDDKFRFIGHSTHRTHFDKDFYSRYVSCSLYTEDINDTFASPFGFIMGSNNIVGAKCEDMSVNNYASDQDTLLHYSSIKKIDHPQRIIDECLKQSEDNNKKGNRKKVYSEVVKDGFEPIGIFCFTDGTKDLNPNYRDAQQLQKCFPNL